MWHAGVTERELLPGFEYLGPQFIGVTAPIILEDRPDIWAFTETPEALTSDYHWRIECTNESEAECEQLSVTDPDCYEDPDCLAAHLAWRQQARWYGWWHICNPNFSIMVTVEYKIARFSRIEIKCVQNRFLRSLGVHEYRTEPWDFDIWPPPADDDPCEVIEGKCCAVFDFRDFIYVSHVTPEGEWIDLHLLRWWGLWTVAIESLLPVDGGYVDVTMELVDHGTECDEEDEVGPGCSNSNEHPTYNCARRSQLVIDIVGEDCDWEWHVIHPDECECVAEYHSVRAGILCVDITCSDAPEEVVRHCRIIPCSTIPDERWGCVECLDTEPDGPDHHVAGLPQMFFGDYPTCDNTETPGLLIEILWGNLNGFPIQLDQDVSVGINERRGLIEFGEVGNCANRGILVERRTETGPGDVFEDYITSIEAWLQCQPGGLFTWFVFMHYQKLQVKDNHVDVCDLVSSGMWPYGTFVSTDGSLVTENFPDGPCYRLAATDFTGNALKRTLTNPCGSALPDIEVGCSVWIPWAVP